jgi:UDP-N-acetylglucosamine 1-carboxyvinyltransferase
MPKSTVFCLIVEVFRIQGGARLVGEVHVTGAKNSSLKLMAAALLAPGLTTIHAVPNILDVTIMAELLRRLGCTVDYDPTSETVTIDVPETIEHRADYDLVRRMRASIAVLGPLVARTGEADVALPGGDAIGSRGLDMHTAGLERMGATVTNEHGYLVVHAPQGGLVGTHVYLDFPSVGATETLLMAAVTANGQTIIDNAAREPEIVDICNMLVAMGGQIEGIGSTLLTITGVSKMHATEHTTVSDRIVAGTWAVAATITRGDVTVKNINPEHLSLALEKLVTAGATIDIMDNSFRVRMDRRPTAVDISTLPFPGFPTDLQPQFIALNSIAEGSAMVTENLFEGRFRFVQELSRLGAEVRTDGHHALIRGRSQLSGAPVEATDIRAGAGLVLAGLVADGETTVHAIDHIDRGYVNFETQLVSLGANIVRETSPGLD